MTIEGGPTVSVGPPSSVHGRWGESSKSVYCYGAPHSTRDHLLWMPQPAPLSGRPGSTDYWRLDAGRDTYQYIERRR